MHQDEHRPAARTQRPGHFHGDRLELLQVLYRHDQRRRIERAVGESIESPGVADDVAHARVLRSARLGGGDELGAGIDAEHKIDLVLQQPPREDALAAAEIEDALAGLRVEQTQGGGQEHMLVIVRPLVADELVVPGRDLVPAAAGRGRRRAARFSGRTRHARTVPETARKM